MRSPHRLVRSRTPAFHAGNTGSNPVGDANTRTGTEGYPWCPFFFACYQCTHMGGKIEFSGQVLLEKQWLDMSLEQVITDVTADCLTMVFERVEVAVAHFRGDLVGNMKKLPDIAVVSGTALIVFDCLH